MSRLRRNYTYNIGDVVNALPNYTLTCTKAGTTSSDPITVQEGTIIDGTCEWNCVNNVGGGGAVEAELGSRINSLESAKEYHEEAITVGTLTLLDLVDCTDELYNAVNADHENDSNNGGDSPTESGGSNADDNADDESDVGDIMYGFRIDTKESDPFASVSYLADAVGMTPAGMDFENDVFDYGSWEHAFFMPRPCMLKYDGTVDYYLDPNNYNFRADGVTPSDVANADYEGNAMMEWGRNHRKIWYKVVPADSAGKVEVYIANYKADDGFCCYSFIGGNNNENEHFYTAIYAGTTISNRIRSLSGCTPAYSDSFNKNVSLARINGDGWDIDCWADRTLINLLLILMGKSLDGNTVCGTGLGGGSLKSTTGIRNTRGLFWGHKSSYNEQIKIFGMEGFYGELRFCNGVVYNNSYYYVKMTKGTYDGSSSEDYNTNATGYKRCADCPTKSLTKTYNPQYISAMDCSNFGFLPVEVEGSSNKYFCSTINAYDIVSSKQPILVGAHGIFGMLFGCNPSVAPTSGARYSALTFKHPQI